MRRALAAVGVAAFSALAAAPATAGTVMAGTAAPTRPVTGIPLARPVRDVDPLAGALALGVRKDRLLKSVVPGPVTNTEAVTVAVGPTGTPAVVTDVQRLDIHAAGNYIVRELGPARRAVGLGDTVPPVLELGQVVWQGFSPGNRTLRAELTLDPGIEAARLPMSVHIDFRDTHGHHTPLRAGGAAPADGTATVTLTNATGVPRTVALGTAAVRPLAAALDVLYAAALLPRPVVPPYAGGGLPTALPGVHAGDEQLTVVAPLRVTGQLGAVEATPAAPAVVRGLGVTATATGADVAGTLEQTATFEVDLRAGQHLRADLDARPWLDPRTLVPPTATWKAWAATHPDPAAVRDATTTAVEAAASAARAAEYSPYLQADTPGTDVSSFRYVIAPATATPRAAAVIRAKPAAMTAAVFALVAVVGNAALLWRAL